MGLKSNPKEIDFIAFYEQLYKECLAMAKYALASGKTIPPDTSEIIPYNRDSKINPETVKDIKPLLKIHAKLRRIVAPAKPGTILLMEESLKNNFVSLLGPFPLVRRLIIVAFISLGVFIGLQAFPQVNFGREVNKYNIVTVLDLLAAAGLGASFAALFMAKKYTVIGTYEDKFEVVYWIRFMLGIMAGFTLSLLINISIPSGTADIIVKLGKPLLAMLGGFSANLVYRIFNRLIESLESLLTGNGEGKISAKEQELKNNMRVMEEDFGTQQKITYGLIDVLKNLDPNTDPSVKNRLTALLEKLTAVEHSDLKKR